MTKPLTIAVFGGRGTGKTAFVKQELARYGAPRMVIWDFKNDPSLEGVGQPVPSLPALIRAMKADRFQLRYLVNHHGDIQAQFELFCAACFEAGCLLMFVDELPEVTKANRAPPAWRRCVNVGRDYRDASGRRKWLAIVGAGQRPAECDKSFIGNADIIHTGRLGHMDDAREMAKAIGCTASELVNLPDLHWFERDASKAGFTKGVLSFAPTAKKTTKKSLPAPAKKAIPKASTLRRVTR